MSDFSIDRRSLLNGALAIASTGALGFGQAMPAWARGMHGGTAARKGSVSTAA